MESLRPWTPVWFGHEVELLGHRMDRSRFVRVNLRICPACFAEDVEQRASGERAEDAQYLRCEWMLAFIFGCARHGIRLVTRCERCGERPKWNVGRIDRCHCGHSLWGQSTHELLTDERALLDELLSKLFRTPGQTSILAGVEGVDLLETVYLLRAFGDLAVFGRRSRADFSSLEIDDLPKVLLAGAEVLNDRPHSFENFLDRHVNVEGSGYQSLERAYGIPLTRLMRSDRAFVDQLRPTFDQHALNAGLPLSIGRAGISTSYAGIAENPSAFLSESETKRLEKALGSEVSRPITRKQALKLCRGRNILAKSTEAARVLGLWRHAFVQVRDAGLIRTTWVRDGGPNQYYYRAELEQFLDAVARDLPRVEHTRDEHLRLGPFTRTQKCSIALIVRKLMAGQLANVEWQIGPRGLRSLLFASRKPFNQGDQMPELLTAKAAMTLLHLDAPSFKALVAEGLMPPPVSDDKKPYVPIDHVRTFAQNFVHLGEIRRATGRARQEIRCALAGEGLKPIPAGPLELYDRTAASSILGPLPIHIALRLDARPGCADSSVKL